MIELTRRVRRKVVTTKGEPLVVALTPEGIWLREPRRRTAFLLPYSVAFDRAARMAADEIRRERQAKRLSRRGAR